jgi:hypothetical protein
LWFAWSSAVTAGPAPPKSCFDLLSETENVGDPYNEMRAGLKTGQLHGDE